MFSWCQEKEWTITKRRKTTHKAYKKKLTKIKLIIEMSGYKQIRKLFTLPLHCQFLALLF